MERILFVVSLPAKVGAGMPSALWGVSVAPVVDIHNSFFRRKDETVKLLSIVDKGMNVMLMRVPILVSFLRSMGHRLRTEATFPEVRIPSSFCIFVDQ